VSMNRVVVDAVHQVRRERKAFGGPVFQAPEGGPLHNLGRVWAKAVEKSGVADFRFHDLRHTAASRMVMEGVDLYTVKEILGHKTLTMTQRYSHLSPEHQRQAVERLATRKRDAVSASGTRSGTCEVALASGDEITTEKKWWTGGELNSRHRDFQSHAFASRGGDFRTWGPQTGTQWVHLLEPASALSALRAWMPEVAGTDEGRDELPTLNLATSPHGREAWSVSALSRPKRGFESRWSHHRGLAHLQLPPCSPSRGLAGDAGDDHRLHA
jgi:hypothetical protein